MKRSLARLTVVGLVLLVFATDLARAADGPAADRFGGGRWSLTAAQRTRLDQALKPLHAQYDPDEQMLREPYHSPGYHTTLKGGFVHGTRPSLIYAVALLDTGDKVWLARAEGVLCRVIGLQDQDPVHKTYGIWPWFLEEPLARMSPPDWNWADFCGVQLLQVAHDHRDRLAPEVRSLVDTAIKHAARSIERRNVGPGYTNIAIMGTYVTLVSSELYGWDDLHRYALARLHRFSDYTKAQGAFTEYNSPTYTIVALSELGRLRLHAKDAEARPLVDELYRMAWNEIASHFHPPTRQWAGPHSRCYSTLLSRGTLALIQRATDGRVNFGVDDPSLTEHRLPLPCPADLEPFFTTLDRSRDVVETFLKAQPPIVGTTHLEPAFALGSVNRGDLWNQRRALVAYWGTAGRPSYLHLRFLRDGYDFAAAQFFSAQHGGDIVAGINFATDSGNTHVSLDRLKGGMFLANDLRLRFEFGGDAGRVRLKAPAHLNDPAHIALGAVPIDLFILHAIFGPETPRWEAGGRGGKAWLDVVVYQGPEREFPLGEIEHAALGLTVRIGQDTSSRPDPSSAVADGRLTLDWDKLRVSIPVRPDKVSVLQRSVKF